MKKRIVFAIFAIMLIGVGLSGCKSKELCPAYTDSHQAVEVSTEDNT